MECCNNNSCGTYSGFSIQKANSNTWNNIEKSTGDSRKIRIGNDINLDVTIQELTGLGVINIKSIKCLIINTTPMMMDLCGNAYEVLRCGLPHYHCLPKHHDGICGWNHPEYMGFGMYPCAHKNWHCNLHPHYDYFYRNPYGRYKLKCINNGPKPFEFIAPVKALEGRNKVRVYFPAAAQLLCGLYSLTFIIELYEPGYYGNNLRTVTVDYNNVFELVPNMEGAAGNILIDIDKLVGLNVVDNLNWGISDPMASQMQNISIIGPDGIKVGSMERYIAEQTPATNNIRWELAVGEDRATLGTSDLDYVIVYGNKITNTVDGYDTVQLYAKATDSSKKYAVKDIKIHNYAVDVDWGSYGGKPEDDIYINLGVGESISAPLYVTQEDGTRLSFCERGSNCQAIEAVCAAINPAYDNGIRVQFGDNKDGEDCSWTYDEVHGNTSSTSNQNSTTIDTKCCPEVTLTITNISATGEARVVLTSQMKDKNGEYITKNIIINSNGVPGGNTQPGDDQPGGDDVNDLWINRGTYSLKNEVPTLTFTYNDTNVPAFDVQLNGVLDTDLQIIYWGER